MPTLDWIGKDKVINHHKDVLYEPSKQQDRSPCRVEHRSRVGVLRMGVVRHTEDPRIVCVQAYEIRQETWRRPQ